MCPALLRLFLWRLTSVTTIFPWVGLCPARNVLLWAFSSTDASVQVCTLPCSSYRVRVVDMLMLIHPLVRACPVRPSNRLHDCMRHATCGLVKQQTGAGRKGQGLVVDGVVLITSGVDSYRMDETLFDRHTNRAAHGNLATENERLERVVGVEEVTTIVVRAARG